MINWKKWSFAVSNGVPDYPEIRKELRDKGLNFSESTADTRATLFH